MDKLSMNITKMAQPILYWMNIEMR